MIITDAATQKKTLVGIFDRFNLPGLPAHVGGFSLYARLTDAQGKYSFRLRFVRLDDDKTLAEVRTNEFEATERLGFYDLVMKIPPLPLDLPGRYEFQLYANDAYVGRTTVDVRLVQK